MCESLMRLAELAPTLREAELRVLLFLSASGSVETVASSRAIAVATRLGRRNAQYAIDAMVSRGLLACDGGSATRASAYRLLFLETAVLPGRGAVPTPPGEHTSGAVPTPVRGADTTPPWLFSDATPRRIFNDLRGSLQGSARAPRAFDRELLD